MAIDILLFYDLKPKRFYPYTSYVRKEIFKMDFSEEYEDEINYIRRLLVEPKRLLSRVKDRLPRPAAMSKLVSTTDIE